MTDPDSTRIIPMTSRGRSFFAQRGSEKEPPNPRHSGPVPSRQRHPGLNAATQARQSHANWLARASPRPSGPLWTASLGPCTAEQPNGLARTSAQLGRTCSYRSLWPEMRVYDREYRGWLADSRIHQPVRHFMFTAGCMLSSRSTGMEAFA